MVSKSLQLAMRTHAVAAATSWICCKYFSGRGAYLQLGTMMGTIMAANVWMRILPSQRRMVAALKAGKEPNLEEGARAKTVLNTTRSSSSQSCSS